MSDKNFESAASLVKELLKKYGAGIERRLLERLDSQHEVMVLELMQKLSGWSQVQVQSDSQPQRGDWIAIDALSQLRALVGGRFDNIKPKWEGAGFPLRAHRGDKGTNYQPNHEGWVELSNWISNRGFEARLGSSEEACLFKIRPLLQKQGDKSRKNHR